MKRLLTFSFLLCAVSLLFVSQAAAQSIGTYNFTGLTSEGDVPFQYVVSTEPAGIVLANSDGSPRGDNTYSMLDGNLTVYIQVPAAGGTIKVIVSHYVADELTYITDATQTFTGSTPTTFNSTTTLISSTGTSFYGDQVTFTATVTGAAGSTGTPSGDVTFLKEGSIPLGTVSLNGSGVAVLNYEQLSVGNHYVMASYVGSPAFNSSHSSDVAEVVSRKPLIVSGITAADKVYDASVNATLNVAGATLAGAVTGETVTLVTSSAVGTFADKNVGLTKQVTVTNLSLTGTNVANYVLSSTPVTTTASISAKTLTVTGLSATDKPYDGTTSATIAGTATLVGEVSGDNLNFHPQSAVGTFDTKNVGVNKAVAISGIVVNGPDVDNYILTQPTTTASISKANASVAAVAANKVYGTPEPAFTGTLLGFVAGDNVTATYGRTSGETVGGSPYTISATLSPAAALDNYTVTSTTAAFTITQANASVTPNSFTKVYGTPDPALTGTLTGFLAADNVTAAYSRTAGETVVGGPYAITATLSPAGVLSNYNITYNPAALTISMNATTTALSSSVSTSVYGQPATFTATVTGSATPTGTVTFKEGATTLGTGALNGAGVATFGTSTLPVGAHSVTAVYGGDANSATSTSTAVGVTVSAKALTVTGVTASNKVYDGSTSATLNASAATLVGVVGADVVTLNSSSATGTFVDKTVGNGKLVTVAGLGLSGAAAPNYTLTQPTATANITAKALTVTGVTANNKVYDGTTAATLSTSTAALVGVVSGDNVTLVTSGAIGTFSDNQVGTNKTVTVSGLTISGTDAGNYTLTQPTTTASITAAPTNTGAIAGAGWISSPTGSYVKKPTYGGKGYFAFAAGYVGNNPLPSGVTAFILKSGSLLSSTAFSFASLSNELLVVSGSQSTLTGTGKVNGSGNFGFMLTVLDGHSSANTKDKLRIKIWDKANGNAVYYDSQMGAADDASPTAVVTGGVITVSKIGGSIAAQDVNIQKVMEDEAAAEIPTEFALYNAYPNPFNPSTTIKFDIPEAAKVRLVVYDMLGREVAVLVDAEKLAGQHTVRFDAGQLSTGTYIYRLQAGTYTQVKKLVLMK